MKEGFCNDVHMVLYEDRKNKVQLLVALTKATTLHENVIQKFQSRHQHVSIYIRKCLRVDCM
jgi:hypothetical protein